MKTAWKYRARCRDCGRWSPLAVPEGRSCFIYESLCPRCGNNRYGFEIITARREFRGIWFFPWTWRFPLVELDEEAPE